MCGIVGYTGHQKAQPVLLDGLTALEYRGYDSAGLFTPSFGAVRAVGAVGELRAKIAADKLSSAKTSEDTAGIAHTRWATHGVPSERNAHPHGDCSGRIWLAHNGIIENYQTLKDELVGGGHHFRSDTDSEVLVHLIEEYLKTTEGFENAVTAALKRVLGTYGIVAIYSEEPDTIVTARMASPIALGIGNGEHIVASDPSAILRHTKDVLFLEDGEVAVLSPSTYRIFTLDHAALQNRRPERIVWDISEAERGGYPHFMLKEIMEGPEVLENSARGRLAFEEGAARLGGLFDVKDELKNVRRIIIVGCGSAYYAGLAGKYMLEEHAGIPVEAELGSEFRYRKMVFDAGTAALAISQSGETADTLASVKEAKRKGLLTLGVVNTVGSTIARETDAGVYNHAGPEIGVASTKAFISQLEVLALLTLFLARQRTMSAEEGRKIARDIVSLPDKVRRILDSRASFERLAEEYCDYDNFLYIGRKYNFATAYEGALKLKEVSYIHAEGYGAGEMKHGPIAMIDEQLPTVAVALKDSVYEKTLSNIEEIRARNGRVLAIATEGDSGIRAVVDDVVYIPEVSEMLSPILAVVPLHLFAYYTGVARGYNVDRPRNLAKSVTVE